MKKFFEKVRNIDVNPEVVLLIVLGILLVVMLSILVNGLNEQAEFDAWYNSLSAEEKAAYEAPYTTTCDVITVEKYHVDITNRYGAVRGTYSCYEFMYVNQDGDIITVHDFRDDWGNYDVVVGESNTYTVNTRTNTRTLTLTLETMKALADVVTN